MLAKKYIQYKLVEHTRIHGAGGGTFVSMRTTYVIIFFDGRGARGPEYNVAGN